MEEVRTTQTPLWRTLSSSAPLQHTVDSAYSASKLAAVLAGAPPVMLAGSAVAAGIKLAVPTKTDEAKSAVVHAGLAADGIVRGLVGAGGALNGAVMRTAPWLVAGPAPTGALGSIGGVLAGAAKVLRVGVVGITGVLGAARAAEAVQTAGSMEALVNTRDGRGGALQAAGAALLLMKHPTALIAGSGLLLLGIANDVL
jgi:hypothetical protein